MVSLSNWFRYVVQKFEYSVSLGWKNYKVGQITDREVGDAIWKNMFQGKLTYIHCPKGQVMAPSMEGMAEALLVRKIPAADPRRVLVGDNVVLKDPENTDKYLVRKLVATEGYEMASTDEKDQPFILESAQCWVLADKDAKPTEVKDSRTFGPVSMSDIVGRVIYVLRNAVDHGPAANSRVSMKRDAPILEVELDVDEMMVKSHKA